MRAIRVAGTALAAALALIVVTALPASAHDELLSSDPPAGARLDAAPTTVSLDFSADVMTVGAAIIIADQNGKDWAASEPEIDNGTVSVEVTPDMPAAGYEIRWRVVSSDGHPISGLIPFTVGDGTPLVRTPVSETPAAGSGVQSSNENQGVPRAVLVGGGAAVAAIAVFILITFVRRRAARTSTQVDEGEVSHED